jgi:hypothetical protein
MFAREMRRRDGTAADGALQVLRGPASCFAWPDDPDPRRR